MYTLTDCWPYCTILIHVPGGSITSYGMYVCGCAFGLFSLLLHKCIGGQERIDNPRVCDLNLSWAFTGFHRFNMYTEICRTRGLCIYSRGDVLSVDH